MDRKRAAAALLALAACIACSAAAPTANDQTALELMDGPSEGCYYNFQHYGEGDRIMTNEPCLNCTCHNRMLMCYLRVCPFTKPIGQDCTVEKRADQCCPIVTCPDVPVDLLTSTSTSSPAEYGTTGVGKHDKYGCSINGKYFSEGSKVPSTPNKPCEHCYCIRNMTTCVMQECTLHVDGCTPIYHKDVCCPVRYSCDHPEDDILLLDDMTTTVRPTPGFLLTTTTALPVTQLTQDCVHDDQIFPDGTLIKTEKACEHCYCMKGDIVCVVQECGTPMENEGKNCTSLPPRHGQCCPDTYICEGDDHTADITTEVVDLPTQPPRRVGVEGSGYRNEPDEPFTETSPFETDIEGSGEDYVTGAPVEDIITEKAQPDIIDEVLLATTEKDQDSHMTEPNKDQNTIPDIISEIENSNPPEILLQTTTSIQDYISTDDSKTTVKDEIKTEDELFSKEEYLTTTESALKKEDNNIVSDEILTIKDHEKLPTTSIDLVDEVTIKDDHFDVSTDSKIQPDHETTIDDTTEIVDTITEKETSAEYQPTFSSTEKSDVKITRTPEEEIFTDTTTTEKEKLYVPETSSINPDINEVDENLSIVSPPSRIPGEGDCLLNGITYRNNTVVPSSNNCHTSCKCTSSIVKCAPIICKAPPENMENMNDCQPIYDSPDACCPTYVCSAKETIPPQPHSQMSGTETPKPISVSDCNGQDCILDEEQKPISEPTNICASDDCLDKPVEKPDQGDCGLTGCIDQDQKEPLHQDCHGSNCQVSPVVACDGENCIAEPSTSLESQKTPVLDAAPSLVCNENGDCKKVDDAQVECKNDACRRQESTQPEMNIQAECAESECKTFDSEKPVLPPSSGPSTDIVTEEIPHDQSTIISFTELDKDVDDTEKTISILSMENITDKPEYETTKLPEINLPVEKLTTKAESSLDVIDTTDKIEQPQPPLIQITSDDSKTTAGTSHEQVTESLELQKDNDEKETEGEQTDRTTIESIEHVTSEGFEIKPDDNFTDKMEITTKPSEISSDHLYTISPDETSTSLAEKDGENQKPGIEVPEPGMIDSDKSTTTPAIHDEDTTVSKIIEIIKEEKTEPPISMEAEKTSIDSMITEHYPALFTNDPNDQSVQQYTEKQETSETPVSYQSHEIITEKNENITDVTTSSGYHTMKNEEVTTAALNSNTEPNTILSELPQSTQTKPDKESNYVTQEVIEDKHEIYTKPPDYLTKLEESTSDMSIHRQDNLSTTEIQSEQSEEATTEKIVTVADSFDILGTKTEDSVHEVEQTVTTKPETYTEIPQHLTEKLDEKTTASPIKQDVEDVETEKEFTKAEFDTTENQNELETFTRNPMIYATTSEEIITEVYETIKDSSTEPPTLFTTSAETTLSTKNIENILKESEIPVITEKGIHDINTTPVTIKESTATIEEILTEKSENIMTEPTSAQTMLGSDSFSQPTSEEPSKIYNYNTESHNLATTIQDNVIVPEITTIIQELESITESQTKIPTINDNKSPESVSQTKNEAQTNIDVIATVTEQSSKETDESVMTSHSDPASENDLTTEHSATVTHKILTEETKESTLTTTSVLDQDHEESTDINKPLEESEKTISKVTTPQPQSEDEKVDIKPTLLPQTEITNQEFERTTIGLISVEEKETEIPSFLTESYIEEQESAKTTSATIVDDREDYVPTKKPIVKDELLPHPTNEYIPVEKVTEETSTQRLQDISTEKTKLNDATDTFVTSGLSTSEPAYFTKSEELDLAGDVDTIREKDKEITPEVEGTYTTSEYLEKISTPVYEDRLDENNKSTTPRAVDTEMERETTNAPILLITDIDHKVETSIPEINEVGIGSTTKLSDNENMEAEKEETITETNVYTTVPQTDVSKEKTYATEHPDITTENIIMTEAPESFSTSHLEPITLSSLGEEKLKLPQQETTTEKLVQVTDDLQSTVEELDKNTEDLNEPTTSRGIISITEEITTQKSMDDLEQSLKPADPTIVSIPKVEMTTEVTNIQVSTIVPSLKPGTEDNEGTEIVSKDQNPTTMYPDEKGEKAPQDIDEESPTITTEYIKSTVTDRSEVNTVIHTSTETIHIVESTVPVTGTKESDIEQEYKITEHPVTEIQISTDVTKIMPEKEILENESQTKGDETTEKQYSTVAEKTGIVSSTEVLDTTDKSEHHIKYDDHFGTSISENEQVPTINKDSEDTKLQSSFVESTTSTLDSETELDSKLTTIITEDTSINIDSTPQTIIEKENLDKPETYITPIDIETATQTESEKTAPESATTLSTKVDTSTTLPVFTEIYEETSLIEKDQHTIDVQNKGSETTPFLVELEEHTHQVVDDVTTKSSLEEIPTTMIYETHESPQPERGDEIPDDLSTNTPNTDDHTISETSKTTVSVSDVKEQTQSSVQEQINENIYTTVIPIKPETEIEFTTEKLFTPASTSELVENTKDKTEYDIEITATTSQTSIDKDHTLELHQIPSSTLSDVEISSDKNIYATSEKPFKPEVIPEEITSEKPSDTTSKISEETSTYTPSHIENVTKSKEKPVDTTLRPAIPEVPKPEFIDEPNEEIPSPDFPPSGGYGQEPDYIDEDQAFGPGTCRYGGKVYVSAQQIPRDDPCDFCFCFRSDIICLQQSCPPPIHGCHEEPIQGFCCPRYECPVSMATTLNVTTTTTTTTTTLPPHFLPHAYKGAAQRRGCQIKGHTYKVGEVVRASSGPCLHCTCGGDGQMKCDPKACTPEPMLRQMIAAAVSAKRRR